MKNKIIGFILIIGSIPCFLISMAKRGNLKCDKGFENCYEIKYLLPGDTFNYVMLLISVILILVGYTLIRHKTKSNLPKS